MSALEGFTPNLDQLPNPKTLAQEFAEQVWEEYGNVTSEPLLKAWEQIFDTFNKCIERNLGGVEPVKQQVLALPTGSGKTAASSYYLDKLEGAGALVITAFIDEAERIKSSFSNRSKVSCYHSESRISGAEINDSQVLIITHSQYINRIQDGGLSQFGYKGQPRPLVIIDESIANINHYTIDESDINTLISSLRLVRGDALSHDLPIDEEMAYLEGIKGMFSEVADKVVSINGVHLTRDHIERIKSNPTALQVIRNYLGERKGILNNANNTISFDSLREVYSKILSASKNPSLFFSKSGSRLLLNTREYVKIEHAHTVVLDATATVDVLYSLREGVEVLPPPEDVRDYSNVTLYISPKAYSLGRARLADMGRTDDKLSASHHIKVFLENQFSFDFEERVLFVTSKSVREKMAFLEKLDVVIRQDHWGNITGKNNYSDCSSVVILGFNFKPEHHISSLHLTTKSADKAIADFGSEGVTDDIMRERKDIKAGNIAAEVVQAINRVRCRNPKEGGSCEPTKVFLYKSANTELFETIQSSIKKQMPGINVEELDQLTLPENFSSEGASKGGRVPVNIPKFFENLDEYEGEYPVLFSEIASGASIPNNSHNNLRKQLNGSKKQELTNRGYKMTRTGKGKSYEIDLI